MASSASEWAKRKAGGTPTPKSASSATASPSSSAPSTSGSSSSVGSASSDSYEDDKFHLPADHQPFLLLPGWDAPPPPPPAPPSAEGSSSGSESGGSDSEDGGSSSGDSGSGGGKPKLPLAAPTPPPPGFSCAHCAMFKALGSGQFGCESEDYQRWSGTDRLVETKSGRPVANPERACSDWFSPATGPSAQPIPTRHNKV